MPHYGIVLIKLDSDEDFMDGSATSHANPLDNWESFDDCHVTPLSEKLNNQKYPCSYLGFLRKRI